MTRKTLKRVKTYSHVQTRIRLFRFSLVFIIRLYSPNEKKIVPIYYLKQLCFRWP